MRPKELLARLCATEGSSQEGLWPKGTALLELWKGEPTAMKEQREGALEAGGSRIEIGCSWQKSWGHTMGVQAWLSLGQLAVEHSFCQGLFSRPQFLWLGE